jgi:type IV secretion system protein VirD4
VNVSEQRRALLLPQEVKELGPDEAIVFLEGLRPIRCRKIRYFEDRRFRARLIAPPMLAPGIAPISRETPPPDSAPAGVDRSLSGTADVSPATREAMLEDLDRLETLTLDDFETDFSRVEMPVIEPGERLSDAQLDAAVESILTSLKGEERTR